MLKLSNRAGDAERKTSGQMPGHVDSLRGQVLWEDRVRLRLAICFALATVTGAYAQQTTTVPPPAPLPSTFPQFQTYTGCVMNCDTRSGLCQSTCSVSNAPNLTFATTPTGARPDPGALAQCYLVCNAQALACKQTCAPPH